MNAAAWIALAMVIGTCVFFCLVIVAVIMDRYHQ